MRRFASNFSGFVFFSFVMGASVHGMEFGTVPTGGNCSNAECPRAMVAEGEISADAPQRFTRFLRDQMQVPGLHAVLFINSPGGNVESALRLGALLHDAGAAAIVGRPVVSSDGRIAALSRKSKASMGVVPGQCASACVYTLMGAKRRVVPSGARLGVHRMSARVYSPDPATGSAQTSRVYAGSPEIAALRDYVSRVGGSQDLITLAESVPHDRIRVLSGQEIRKFRLGSPKL